MKPTTLTVSEYLKTKSTTPSGRITTRVYRHVINPTMIVAEWDKMAKEGVSPSAGSISKRLNIINPATGKRISRQQILNLLKVGDPDRFGKMSKQKPHQKSTDYRPIIIKEFAPPDWRGIFPDAQIVLLKEVQADTLLLLNRVAVVGDMYIPLHYLEGCRKILQVIGNNIYGWKITRRPVL